MVTDGLTQEQILQITSQLSAAMYAYPQFPLFANANSETGFGQVHPFGHYTRTEADALGDYSGASQLILNLLLKSTGLVPDTWNYMPRGMPLVYGAEAMEARQRRMQGYADMRQQVVADRAIELGGAAARHRGEVFTLQRQGDLRHYARQFDMASMLLEGAAPEIFEAMFGPTGSGLALYDVGHRVASYRTHYDGTRYSPQEAVRYGKQFMEAMHDRTSLITSREAAAFYSHLNSHGLMTHVRERDSFDIPDFDEMTPEQRKLLEDDARQWLFTDEARGHDNVRVRQAANRVSILREINEIREDMKNLYKASHDPDRDEAYRNRNLARFQARSQDLSERVQQAQTMHAGLEVDLSDVLGDLARLAPFSFTPTANQLSTLSRGLFDGRAPQLALETFGKDNAGLSWLVDGITSENKEKIRDAVVDALDSTQEIERIEKIKAALREIDPLEGPAGIVRKFNEVQQQTQEPIASSYEAVVQAVERIRQTPSLSDAEKREQIRASLRVESTDDSLVIAALKLAEESRETLDADSLLTLGDVAMGAAVRRLDSQAETHKKGQQEAFSQILSDEGVAKELEKALDATIEEFGELGDIQALLDDFRSDPAFQSFVRNNVNIRRAGEDFREYKKGLEILKEVMTSTDMSPDQIARLYTSFSGGAMLATSAEELSRNVNQIYAVGRQLGYGDEELQSIMAQSQRMADMTGVNRRFVAWHGQETMTFDLINRYKTPEQMMQGVWGARNLNEVSAKQSQVAMGFIASEDGNLTGTGLRLQEAILDYDEDVRSWRAARSRGDEEFTLRDGKTVVRVDEFDPQSVLAGTDLNRWLDAKRAGHAVFTTAAGERLSTRINDSQLYNMAVEAGLPGHVNYYSMLADDPQNQRALFGIRDDLSRMAAGSVRSAIVQGTMSDLIGSFWDNDAYRALSTGKDDTQGQARQTQVFNLGSETMMDILYNSEIRQQELDKITDPIERARFKETPMLLLQKVFEDRLREGGFDTSMANVFDYRNTSGLTHQHAMRVTNQGLVESMQNYDVVGDFHRESVDISSREGQRAAGFSTLLRANMGVRDALKTIFSGELSTAEAIVRLSGAVDLNDSEREVLEEYAESSKAVTRAETARSEAHWVLSRFETSGGKELDRLQDEQKELEKEGKTLDTVKAERLNELTAERLKLTAAKTEADKTVQVETDAWNDFLTRANAILKDLGRKLRSAESRLKEIAEETQLELEALDVLHTPRIKKAREERDMKESALEEIIAKSKDALESAGVMVSSVERPLLHPETGEQLTLPDGTPRVSRDFVWGVQDEKGDFVEIKDSDEIKALNTQFSEVAAAMKEVSEANVGVTQLESERIWAVNAQTAREERETAVVPKMSQASAGQLPSELESRDALDHRIGEEITPEGEIHGHAQYMQQSWQRYQKEPDSSSLKLRFVADTLGQIEHIQAAIADDVYLHPGERRRLEGVLEHSWYRLERMGLLTLSGIDGSLELDSDRITKLSDAEMREVRQQSAVVYGTFADITRRSEEERQERAVEENLKYASDRVNATRSRIYAERKGVPSTEADAQRLIEGQDVLQRLVQEEGLSDEHKSRIQSALSGAGQAMWDDPVMKKFVRKQGDIYSIQSSLLTADRRDVGGFYTRWTRRMEPVYTVVDEVMKEHKEGRDKQVLAETLSDKELSRLGAIESRVSGLTAERENIANERKKAYEAKYEEIVKSKGFSKDKSGVWRGDITGRSLWSSEELKYKAEAERATQIMFDHPNLAKVQIIESEISALQKESQVMQEKAVKAYAQQRQQRWTPPSDQLDISADEKQEQPTVPYQLDTSLFPSLPGMERYAFPVRGGEVSGPTRPTLELSPDFMKPVRSLDLVPMSEGSTRSSIGSEERPLDVSAVYMKVAELNIDGVPIYEPRVQMEGVSSDIRIHDDPRFLKQYA